MSVNVTKIATSINELKVVLKNEVDRRENKLVEHGLNANKQLNEFAKLYFQLRTMIEVRISKKAIRLSKSAEEAKKALASVSEV